MITLTLVFIYITHISYLFKTFVRAMYMDNIDIIINAA